MSDERIYGHALQEYTVERVRAISREREAARAKVKTKAQLLKLQAGVRRKLRRCFGPRPKRTALNLRVTGRVERKDYSIDKLIYDSRPGFPVTANLYIPKRGSAPFPAVLGTCGHAAGGKAEPYYQSFVKNLARMGYVVLIYDPISQGERMQYLGLPKSRQPGGLCNDHNMMGNQMRLVGDFFGSWRAWDGIRSLDVLLSRPETDRTRVGLTGNSGGGTMTTWLTGLDPRFTMAAPSCFVTRQRSNLENEESQDAEQVPPGLLAAGLDHADFYLAYAPRPTILLGKSNDFFDHRGLEATFEELRRLYRVAGAEKNIELFSGPGDHGFTVENREAMYRFFNKHAGVRARTRETRPPKVEIPAVLHAAPEGQVHHLKPRTVFNFTKDAAGELASRRKPLKGAALKKTIAKLLALPERADAPHYRVLRTRWLDRPKKRTVCQNMFPLETEPGVQAMIQVFSKQRLFRFPERVPAATLYVPHLSSRDEFAAGDAPKGDPLFTVDVRGVGCMAPRTCGESEFFAPYDSDYMYATYGDMLDEPYCGRRVHDLLCALDLLKAKGCRDVHLVGRGLGAVWSTFAGVLHPAVKRVTLHNALLSYHELTQTPVYKWPMSSLVPGILNDVDLADCLRELEKKGLTLVDPWTASMRKWRRPALRSHLKTLGLSGVRMKV
jgi:dienelactone hydrolase